LSAGVSFSACTSQCVSLIESLSVSLSQCVSLSERACRCFFDWCFFDWCFFDWCFFDWCFFDWCLRLVSWERDGDDPLKAHLFLRSLGSANCCQCQVRSRHHVQVDLVAGLLSSNLQQGTLEDFPTVCTDPPRATIDLVGLSSII